MAINIFDTEKDSWKQISSMMARNQKLVDAAGNYNADNVEDALKEVADKMRTIVNDVQYIYENGTIGGGGGGGGSLPKVTTSFDRDNVTSIETISIPFQFSSPNIGKGVAIGRLNNIEIYKKTVDMGPNIWIFDAPLPKGTHIIELYVIDIAGLHSNMITLKINCGELEVKYNDKTPQLTSFIVATDIAVYYNVETLSTDDIYIKYTLNNEELPREKINKGQNAWRPDRLAKGRHTLRIMASMGTVESNEITYSISVIDADEFFLGSSFVDCEMPENIPFSVPFITSFKGHEECYIDCYIDGDLERRLRVNMGTGTWQVPQLLKKAGDEPYELKIIARTLTEDTSSEELVFNVTIGDNPYSIFPHHTQNLVAWFAPSTSSNEDVDRNFWRNNVETSDITCELFDFNYVNNGFIDITDRIEDANVTPQGITEYSRGLLINGEAYAVIDYSPFIDNISENGMTIEATVRIDNVGDLNAFAMFSATNAGAIDSDRGLWIKAQQVAIDGVETKNHVDIGENNWARISFIINKKDGLSMIYIDGILSGVKVINNLENFQNDCKIYLNCGINSMNDRFGFGQCFFQTIKIYDTALSYDLVVKNYIAEIKNADLQRKVALRNDTTLLPSFFVKGDFSSLGDTENPLEGKHFQILLDRKETGGNDVEHFSTNFARQGTSSAIYSSPNYTFKTMQYGVEGDEGMGVPFMTNFHPDWEDEYVYTLKADFMESSHSNNIGLAKFIHDVLALRAPSGLAIGDARRCAVDGYPVLLKTCWTNESSSEVYIDRGVYMLNLDRYSNRNYGMGPGSYAYEGAFNNELGAVAFNNYDQAVIGNEWKQIYPGGLQIHSEFANLIQWVKESPDQNFRNIEEFETHLSLEHCVKYYLMMSVFGLIDNIGKNLRMAAWGKEGGDWHKWYPVFYDLDTALGLNNQGEFVVESFVEMGKGGDPNACYNVQNSKLWTRLETHYQANIVETYHNLRSTKKFDPDYIIGFFKDNIIDKISEEEYNKDAQIKYINSSKDSELGMAQGTRIQKVRRWLIERFSFCDSLYGYDPIKDNRIGFRTNAGGETVTLNIKTYEPQYLSVKFNAGADGTQRLFCNKDSFTTFSGVADRPEQGGSQNQEMFIYSANNIMEIGGISGRTQVAGLFLEAAKRLRKLDVSGSKIITNLSVTTMSMLQELHCHGCTALKTAIDLEGCPNLKVFDAHGEPNARVPITGVSFSEGGNLITANLSYTDVSVVRIKSQPFLREIDLTGCSKLVTFELEDCPKLERIILPQSDLQTFIAKRCPNLGTIDINTGKELTNVELYGLTGLHTLIINNNYKIAKCLNLTGCPNLVTLNASSCSNLRLIAFNSSAKATLRDVNLSSCTSFYGIKTFTNQLIGLMTEADFGVDPCLDFDGFTDLGNLNFSNCQSIERVRNLQYIAPGSTSMFYNCRALESFENSKLTLCNTVSDTFRGCAMLSVFPTFDMTQVTNASRTFEGCQKLTVTHLRNIMASFSTALTTQYRLFNSCTGIIITGTSFPTTLFNSCPNLTTISEMFGGCNKITCEFPEYLLRPLTKLRYCHHAFSGCKFTGKLKSNTFSCITNGTPNTNIWRLDYMFNNNNFIDYDEDIFSSLEALIEADGFFASNSNLCKVHDSAHIRPNYVRENLFANNRELLSVRSFFAGTPFHGTLWKENPQGGEDLPILLFKHNKKLRDVSNFFANTEIFGEIPERIFDNSDGSAMSTLVNISSFFSGTNVSGNIPENLLIKNENITDASYLFNECRHLIHKIIFIVDEEGNEISRHNQPFPPQLFQQKPELAYVTGAFKGCVGLAGQLPDKIFFGSPKVEMVNRLFEGCNALTNNIPEDLLAYSNTITDASSIFYGCGYLTSFLPPLLFEKCTNVVTLQNAFRNCYRIRGGVPEGFLDNCVKLQNVSYMFGSCEALNELGTNHTYAIPENLFINCLELNDVSHMFHYCHRLKGTTKQIDINTEITYGIPPNLFYSNVKLQNASYMFWACYALSGEIPEMLFAMQNDSLQYLQFMFAGCGQLSRIHINMFGVVDPTTGEYDEQLPGILNFEETFSGCSGLRGEVPQLWISHRGAKSTKCFTGVTQVENIDDLNDPLGGAAWK